MSVVAQIAQAFRLLEPVLFEYIRSIPYIISLHRSALNMSYKLQQLKSKAKAFETFAVNCFLDGLVHDLQ
jgi:hypothetical protein